MIANDLLKGTLRTIVLKLLADNGRMYGYEITKKVEELSTGKIKLTFGALYPVLHKLEADGHISHRNRVYRQAGPEVLHSYRQRKILDGTESG
jgi:PadR family transcriptional regulator PadR